jgi:hypothetical protein
VGSETGSGWTFARNFGIGIGVELSDPPGAIRYRLPSQFAFLARLLTTHSPEYADAYRRREVREEITAGQPGE